MKKLFILFLSISLFVACKQEDAPPQEINASNAQMFAERQGVPVLFNGDVYVPKVYKNTITGKAFSSQEIEVIKFDVLKTYKANQAGRATTLPAGGCTASACCATIDQNWLPAGYCCGCYWQSPTDKCVTFVYACNS